MLTRQDVLAGEADLCADIAMLFAFEGHALYFPPSREVDGIAWVEEEKTLLVPLWLPVEKEGVKDELLLGVLLLRGIEEDMGAFLPILPAFIRQSLEKLVLKKQVEKEPLTGLATREALIAHTAREIARMRQIQTLDAREESLGVSPSLAIVALCVEGLCGAGASAGQGAWTRLFGHAFVREVEAALGKALGLAFTDKQEPVAFPAFLGEGQFAVLISGAGQKEAEDAAYTIFGVCQQVQPELGIAAHSGIGYALFPQDWDGRLPFSSWRKIYANMPETRQPELVSPVLGSLPEEGMEDALALLSFALLTARKCAQRASLGASFMPGPPGPHVQGFSRLLSHGGTVTEAGETGHDRFVRLNLGRDAGVRPGMVFCVKSAENASVAEVCVRYTEENTAYALLLTQYNPLRPPYPGERVVFSRMLGEEEAFLPEQEGLLSVAAMRARIAQEKEPFVLALVRLGDMPEQKEAREAGHGLPHIQAFWEYVHAEQGNTLAAVYNPEHLLLLHTGVSAENTQTDAGTASGCTTIRAITDFYARFSAVSDSLPPIEGVGLFAFPYLDYTSADALDNVQKALEYALLLPEPHIGLFDTLAINISADKRFSQGDTLGAMAEYRRALLADEKNALAWNSLGVCLASLGRYAEALEALEKAAHSVPCGQYGENAAQENMPVSGASQENLPGASVHYNLGTTALSLGDKARGKKAFQDCIHLEPTHIFAYLRLGQLEEEESAWDLARTWYETALQKAPHGPHYRVFRALARLEMACQNPTKAREYLHKALAENSQDAQSLALMAQLYLESGEDVALAESLARQSVALMPSENPAWAILQKCLVLEQNVT